MAALSADSVLSPAEVALNSRLRYLDELFVFGFVCSFEDLVFALSGGAGFQPRGAFWQQTIAGGWPELRRWLLNASKFCQVELVLMDALEATGAAFGASIVRRLVGDSGPAADLWVAQRLPRLNVDLLAEVSQYDDSLCQRRLLHAVRSERTWWTHAMEDRHLAWPSVAGLLLRIADNRPSTAVAFVRAALAENRPAPSPNAPVSFDRTSAAAVVAVRLGRRGLCCVLNIARYEKPKPTPALPDPKPLLDRWGSERDVARIQETFRALGYHLMCSSSCSPGHSGMMTEQECLAFRDACIEEFIRGGYTHFAMFAMGHGEGGDVILTSDLRNFHCIDDLVSAVCTQSQFSNAPKLFVFQFCRGDHVNVYTDGPSEQLAGPVLQDYRNSPALNISFRDVYMLYSTLPRYTAMRTDDGSLFIQFLCDSADAKLRVRRPVVLDELTVEVNRWLTEQNPTQLVQPIELKKWGPREATLRIDLL